MLERNEAILKRKFRQYLLPGIMLTAALQIGNIVDSMLVGNLLGPDAMSAVKLGMTVDNIVEIPGYVLGVGGSIAAGIYMGKREIDKAKKVFSTTFAISLMFGIIFSVLSIWSGQYAQWLCGDSPLLKDTQDFVFVTLLLAPVLNTALQMINYVAVDNNPNLASAYVITANVLNLLFDYLLLNYTELGTAGAALSTNLGYGLALLLLIGYVRSKKRLLSFVSPFDDLKKYLTAALQSGIPTLLYMIFLTIKDMTINTLIIKSIGEYAMIIYTVCFNITLCVQLFAGGIVGLLSNMGSILYGEKDYFGIKSLIKYILIYSYSVVAVFMAVTMIKPDMFLGLFGITEAESVNSAIGVLRIYTLSLPVYLWNHFMMVYYQSTDKTKLAGIITSLQTCLAVVPIAYILVYWAQAAGGDLLNAMILAFVLGEIATLVITFIYQRIKYRDQNYFMIPADAGESLDYTLSNNAEDIQQGIKEVFDFCSQHEVPRETANRMAVAIEEMIVNIFKFGGKGVNNVDISIRLIENKLNICLTDDGIPFDPTEYKEADESLFEIHGIQVVKSIATDVEYLRVMDLNHTTIAVEYEKQI